MVADIICGASTGMTESGGLGLAASVSVTTIYISISPEARSPRLFLWVLPQTFRNIRTLKREYNDWAAGGIIRKRRHRIGYLIDHFVLWPFYCMIAMAIKDVKGICSWKVESVNLKNI